MYNSKFATDMIKMLDTLHNSGLQMEYLDSFLKDFDCFCVINFPDDVLLTSDIAEAWIHNTSSKSSKQMSRRVCTMKHLGRYQRSLGKPAYVPDYSIKYRTIEEPRLFSDEQLREFFEKEDTMITPTKTFPYNDIIFPVMFRMNYCCGLRSSESCNLKAEDVDLSRGRISIYKSKGFKDRDILMSDDLCALCRKFDEIFQKILPERKYFFQPSESRERYDRHIVLNVFNAVLKKTSFADAPGKNFTPHGLRHLFAVQNIRKCAESGEDFSNWIEYLCKYMGHKHIRYTMYYLHITSQLFPVYKDKLKLLGERIGVMYVEEE